MPTKNTERPKPSQAYEAALARFEAGIERIGAGDYAAAREILAEVAPLAPGEPELAQRAHSYRLICDRRLAAAASEPATAGERYSRAVFLSNAGNWDEALRLLDQALLEDPSSIHLLYARASTWALKGSTDRAVADLRRAIAGDPGIRFQAVNDSDFEKIREEPAFIDTIEPTPTGA